jgi:K+-sensing histidine kinase KdpD
LNLHNQIKKTHTLLENLLQWAQLQKGLIVPQFQFHNLYNIINDAVMQNIETASTKGLVLVSLLTEPIWANCDIDLTRAILRNLISDAIKFTKQMAK